MSGQTNSPGIRMLGYLQHKGKKKLMSFWRKYYCVLNGRILLFYTSESAYQSLENYLRSLDLGLVYAVAPALGMGNAIQVSTHLGPQWLKVRDEASYDTWLEALRRACNSSTEKKYRTFEDDEMLHKETKEFSSDRIQCRKIKGNVSRTDYSFEETNLCKREVDEKSSSFKRVSLNIFPGHGRQYPTYDGMRKLKTAGSSLEVVNQDIRNEPDLETGQRPKLMINTAMRRVKEGKKNPRPLSESVSDFLLLNSPTKKEAPFSLTTTSLGKRKVLQYPRIPTNDKVDKLLLHAGSDFADLGAKHKTHSKKDRPIKSLTNLLLASDKHESMARATSDSNVMGFAENTSPEESALAPESTRDINKPLPPTENSETDHENSNACQVETSNTENLQKVNSNLSSTIFYAVVDTEDQSHVVSVHERKVNSKKVRRKSSLAKLKNLLFPTKTSKSREQSHKSISKDKTNYWTPDCDQITQDQSPPGHQEEFKTDNLLKGYEKSADNKLESGHTFQHSYQQQISEGNESVIEEIIVSKKSFECEGKKSTLQNEIATDEESPFELPVQRRKFMSGDHPSSSSAVEARQRKFSMQVPSNQNKEQRNRRPSTRSFEFENNSRHSRTLDRRSTVRALDFNFDLTLDVGVVDRLLIPPKTRARATSPGIYDRPNTRCRHCSLPISLLLMGNSEVQDENFEDTAFIRASLISTFEADTDMSDQNRNSLTSSNQSSRLADDKKIPLRSNQLERTVDFLEAKEIYLSVYPSTQNEERNKRLSYAVAKEEVVLEETLDQLDVTINHLDDNNVP